MVNWKGSGVKCSWAGRTEETHKELVRMAGVSAQI
jgi:hypothetical protein